MIARIRQLLARRKLALIVKQTRQSFAVQDYRRRRAAMLRFTRGEG